MTTPVSGADDTPTTTNPPNDAAPDLFPAPGVRSLDAYLLATAAADPTPGGGSVIAVVAALAAALAAMVVRLTKVPLDAPEASPSVRDLLPELDRLRQRLLSMAAADEIGYRRYREASSRARATSAEQAARTEAMQNALVESIEVPLKVATACGDLASLLEAIAREGNRHVLADAQIAAWLTEVATKGAILNVRGNAALLRDHSAADRYRAAADALEQRVTADVGSALVVARARAR